MVGREYDGYLLQLANVRQQTAGAWLNAIYAKKAVSLQQKLLDHMNNELALLGLARRRRSRHRDDTVALGHHLTGSSPRR